MSDIATVVEDQTQADVAAMPDQELIEQLAGRARSQGLALTGEGGLLGKLTKMVIESALEGEIADHLGYAKHDVAGRDGGNSRNGAPQFCPVPGRWPHRYERPGFSLDGHPTLGGSTMTTPQRPDLRGELLQRAERDQPAARAITAQVDAGDVRIRYVGRRCGDWQPPVRPSCAGRALADEMAWCAEGTLNDVVAELIVLLAPRDPAAPRLVVDTALAYRPAP